MSLRRAALRVAAEIRLTFLAIWRGVVGVYRSDDLTFASSIAYYALLSLFPFFLLAFALLGTATADENNRNSVFNFVLTYFPTQFDFLTHQLDAFRNSRGTLGVAGTIALVWGALGFFGAISTAVNYAWGVEKQRSFWKHKLLSFVMLLVAGLILLVALLLVSASQVVGATWFTEVLWKGVLEAFSWYVHDMSRFTRVNGSIAAVVVFLVWVYMQAVILLYGVEFTAAYARLRRGRPEEVPAAPTPRT